ncbi:hypothetical protein NFI96_023427 [Prochilodus magdalenae]|nr:hypothetical protein NFI96_023427 [Prochilodus magdalenae]
MDAPSKLFFGLEQKNGQKRLMHAVRTESGDLLSEPAEICKRAVSFFSKLYTSEQSGALELEESFLHRLPKLTRRSAETLDRALSLDELYTALKIVSCQAGEVTQSVLKVNGGLCAPFQVHRGIRKNWEDVLEKLFAAEGGRSGSHGALSRANGFRCVPAAEATAEDVLLAVGERVGHEHIYSASRMNNAVVVFLKDERLVNQLVESGIWVLETFVPVSPLLTPATKVTISNVPPFLPSELLAKELGRFGKLASAIAMIPLGCKNAALKHVLSFRRQVFMFLTSPDKTLEVSFRVPHGDSSYMVYASTDSLRCFECGDIAHKRFACPLKDRAEPREDQASTSAERSGAGAEDTAGKPPPDPCVGVRAAPEVTERR